MNSARVTDTRCAAMEFLLSHNFSIDTMCSSGVRYLSRVEEKLAIERAIERCGSRSPIPNMDIQEDDIECLQFVASARLAINEWIGQGEVSH
jgi:poly(A)-specific ribonuclease